MRTLGLIKVHGTSVRQKYCVIKFFNGLDTCMIKHYDAYYGGTWCTCGLVRMQYCDACIRNVSNKTHTLYAHLHYTCTHIDFSKYQWTCSRKYAVKCSIMCTPGIEGCYWVKMKMQLYSCPMSSIVRGILNKVKSFGRGCVLFAVFCLVGRCSLGETKC